LQSFYTTFCFLPPVRLTLTPRVLGTSYCVLLLQVPCRMKKLLSGVKRALSSGPSSRGSSPRSGNGSQDSARSSSFVPLLHETEGSIRYPAHNEVPMVTDGDDISIHSTAEMEKYESLRQREFGHTRVYNVNLLEGVEWMKSFPSSFGLLFGENSRGLDDSSNGWITLHTCKRRCKPPSTHRRA
jgi:hypothetical protein